MSSNKNQKLSPLDKGEYPEGGRELIKKHPPTNHIINQPNLQKFRRTLRKEGTPAEGALWKILKNKQVEGLRFHRQYSIDNYILDFYCPKIKLAIELDGDYHYHTFVPDHDYERDKELLEKYGIKTIRFENKDVWEQPQSIVDCIVKEATK